MVARAYAWWGRWNRSWLWALLVYAAIAATILRGDFGTSTGTLPQGTNAQNAYTMYVFQQHYGSTDWLAPYTDWGQPLNGYPGWDLQNLVALSGLVGPTEYVRVGSFLAFVLSGLSMAWIVVQFGGTRFSALIAGCFYELLGEVPHFFEGHLSIMISIALAPLLLVLALKFFEQPTLGTGLTLAAVVFLATSIGDLGELYRILFFAGLFSAGLIIYRLARRPYTRPELVAVALSAVTLVVLLLPWILTYLGGVRPEFTTSILSSIQPFAATGGQSLYPLFIGFAGDNSYSYFFLHSYTYAWDFGQTQYLFAGIPLLAGAYAVGFGRLRDRLLYASGVFAMFVSTGPLYPSISVMNEALYRYVPFFDTDPLLFHWNIYYILVVGLFFGLGLSKLERRLLRGRSPAAPDGTAAAAKRNRSSPSRWFWPAQLVTGSGRGAMSRLGAGSVVLVIGISLLCAASPVVQNWEAFSEPPGTFNFPSNYTAGYSYVAAQAPLGGVLSVPFGNIYERTPWGGVSASSQLIAGLATNRNLAIFEAGTPQSLALDTVIGAGLADSDSNNLTKLLNATGIQYIVETVYPNWSYASDPTSNPRISNEGLAAQQGLGSPLFQSSFQSVFRLPEPAGNVSVFHDYLVYEGDTSLLFELMNQPWYNGSVGLVCLCDVPSSEDEAVIAHASGFVTSPGPLENLSANLWRLLVLDDVPLGVVVGAGDYQSLHLDRYSSPWNASNGEAVGTSFGGSFPLTTQPFLDALADHGYSSSWVSIRAYGPSTAPITIATDGGHQITGDLGPGSGFRVVPLGSLPISASTRLEIDASPFVRIDTLVLWSGGTPRAAPPRQDVYAPQPDLTDESFTLNGSGWALVQIPQVYSSLWQLDGPVQTSDHLTMDIGLNGWLVNTTGPVSLRIVYQGVPLLLRANIAEGVGLVVLAVGIPVIYRQRRAPSRVAGEPGPKGRKGG